MKTKLLFIGLFISTFINSQSIEFTSAELTTAEIGSTIKIDYKYTIAADGYIYCAIELLDDWTWSANVANAELDPTVAGTDVTGSFELIIPDNIALTADLIGNLNYKLKIEIKQDRDTWLAGKYPATQIDITGATASTNTVKSVLNDISIFPNPTKNTIQIKGADQLKISNVKISNVLGIEVLKPNFNKTKIDISNLNSGIYILSIQSNNKSKSLKFIKQ